MKYFNPLRTAATPGTQAYYYAKVAKVYTEAGLTAPARATDDIATWLTEQPTAQTVAQDIAATIDSSAETPDPEEWFAAASERIRRAQVSDLLREHINQRSATYATAMRVAADRAAHDLEPHFRSQVAKLRKAAAALSNGPGMLGVEANFAAHTTREHEAALAALAALGRIAGVFPPGTGPSVTGMNRDALCVVDVPAVPVERVHQLSGEPLDHAPVPDRDAVRAFFHDAATDGIDEALVAVAQGRYGDVVKLSLASSVADLHARQERACTALQPEVVLPGITDSEEGLRALEASVATAHPGAGRGPRTVGRLGL